MTARWTAEDVARDEQGRAPRKHASAERRDECFAAIDAMSATIDRLTAALEQIAEADRGLWAGDIARKALGRE